MEKPRKLTNPTSAARPSSQTSIRPRRILLVVLLIVITVTVFGAPWSLPESLKDSGGSLTRANIAKLVRPGRTSNQVDEIWGLLHMVTRPEPTLLSHGVRGTEGTGDGRPIALKLYGGGSEDVDWPMNVRELKKENPVVIFSKTYCPYSRRAKALIETYALSPAPTIVEVDLRDDGLLLKSILTRLTGRGTFPNVIVAGTSIGGSDDVHALHASGKLRDIFEAAGVKVTGDLDST